MDARTLLGAGVAMGAGALLAIGWAGGRAPAPEPAPGSMVRQFPPDQAPAAVGLAAGVAPVAQPQGAAPRVELMEVGWSRSGREVALLRVGGGAPQRFAVGDVVGSGVRLVRILPHGVELQRGAVLEHVLADSKALAPHPRATPLRYGADAIADDKPAVPDVVVSAIDLPPASSNGVDRAIARARSP